MGNLLSKFRFPLRRRPLPGRNRPLRRLALHAHPPPVRDHPAAPSRALGPGHRLFHRDHKPLQVTSHMEPPRRYLIPQAACTSLGVLPLVNWSNPPKKPVLSSRNSLMFGPSRGVRIPPPGRKVTLPRSLSERVEVGEPVPSRHRPLLCPNGMEEKVQKDPREKMEDLVETKEEDGGNRAPHSCGDIPLTSSPPETHELLSSEQCKPAPLDIHPNPPEDSLRKNTKSLINSSPEGHVVTSSHGPARHVMPDPDATVLSDPTKEVLGENHQSSESTSDLSRKEIGGGQPSGMTSTKEVSGENHQPVGDAHLFMKEKQASEPSGNSSGSSFPPVSASRRLCKRKISMPSSLLLPPPQPQLWDRGELPPPPKLPCIAIDKNLDTLKNTKRQRNKILEERTQIRADCLDSQPAPALSVLAPQTAACLPLGINTLQVPIPIADLADPSARPPIPSVPPSLTQNIGQEIANIVFKPSPAVPAGSLPPLSSNPIQGISLKNEGPLQPVMATTSICDFTTLPNTSIPTLQPPSCKAESPEPMCADLHTLPNTSTPTLEPPSCKAESPEPMCVNLPPPVQPTPPPNPSTNSAVSTVLPISYKAVASTIATNASLSTSKLTSHPGAINMGTTPPSKVIFIYCQVARKGPPSSSQDRPSLKRKSSANIPVSTSAPGYQKTALLASVAVPTSLPLGGSGVTSAPVGNPPANCNSASDEAMDTTSPSQASIFYSSPVFRDNHVPLSMVLPGSDKTPPSSSTVVAQDSIHLPKRSSILQTSVANQSGPGITSQPTTGHHYGQQPNNTYLLGSLITSTRAMGPTARVAKRPRDNTVQSGLAGSASSTTTSIQPTSNGPPQNPCGLPGHSASVAVASGSTNSVLGPTCNSIHLPNNGGPPAQHTDSKHGGDNVSPTVVGPGILASQQNNCSRPNANAASAVADIVIIISMMAGLYVSTPYKNNGSSRTPKKDGALGKSSTPAMTN